MKVSLQSDPSLCVFCSLYFLWPGKQRVLGVVRPALCFNILFRRADHLLNA